MPDEKKKKSEDDDSGDGLLKAISLTPVVTALLKPTAQYLGKELKEFVQSGVERLKQGRRDENLAAHLKAVQDRLREEDESAMLAEEATVARLIIIGEWTTYVEDVDPRDKELSDIWDGLLAAAVRGENVSLEVMHAIKSLTPDEAMFLLQMKYAELGKGRMNLASEKPRLNTYLRKSLSQKRMIERSANIWLLTSVLVVSVIAITLFVEYEVKLPERSVFRLLGLTTAIGVFGGLLAAYLQRWKLTWLGCKVVMFALPKSMRSTE